MTEETLKCRHCEQEFAKDAEPPNAVYCHPCINGVSPDYEWLNYMRERYALGKRMHPAIN